MFRERFHSRFIVFVGSGKGATWSSSDCKAIIGSYSLEQDTACNYYTPRYVSGGSPVSACFQAKREEQPWGKDRTGAADTIWSSRDK